MRPINTDGDYEGQTAYLIKRIFSNPAGIYLLKVNNRNTRTKVWNMFKAQSFGGFIVNFEHISHLCSSISIVNFE